MSWLQNVKLKGNLFMAQELCESRGGQPSLISLTFSVEVKQHLKKKKKKKKAYKTGMWQCSTSTFEDSCGCTALDMLESREMTEQTDWREKSKSQVVCVSEDLKCWGP